MCCPDGAYPTEDPKNDRLPYNLNKTIQNPTLRYYISAVYL